MTTITKPRITNLEELKAERIYLRSRVECLELDLKEHYGEIREKVQSVTAIFGVVSKIKHMFVKDKNEDGAEEPADPKSMLVTALKATVPLIAGGLFLRRGKKLMLRSIIGYGLGQATKYLFSKNINEHVSSVKGIFSNEEKAVKENGIF